MRGDGTDRMHEQLLAGFPIGRVECLRGQTHSVFEVIVLTMPVNCNWSMFLRDGFVCDLR